MAPAISVVIPVKDERDSIPALAQELAVALRACHWEALWVDDGSVDGSGDLLAALGRPHRVLRMRRPSGQSAALLAGFRVARGRWIGTIDGDGQNDPADLPRLLYAGERDGVDMVTGYRVVRRDTCARRLASRVGNFVRDRITGDAIRDVGCATRVFRRGLVPDLPNFRGMHRFLPTLARMRGATIAEMPVAHRPRAGGRSKYGINDRLWCGLRDCFGVRWLRQRSNECQVDELAPPVDPALCQFSAVSVTRSCAPAAPSSRYQSRRERAPT